MFALPFLLRNLLMPMVADDYAYAFVWDGDHYGNLMDNIGPRQRIRSFYDILVSQWSHYFTWGGRTPSMVFIQLFAWVGKVWFDVANTLVFVLLMLALYSLATTKECCLQANPESSDEMESPACHKATFLWVMLCMLFGVIDYPSTMLWMTGACVYLWTGLWECLFLLSLLRGRRVNMLLMVLLGLLAGWSEEGGSLITVVLSALFVYKAWRQNRLGHWMVAGFTSLLVGFTLLMLCPGSLHREELMLQLAPEYVLPADKLFSLEMFRANFTEGLLPILFWESFLFIPIIMYGVSGFRLQSGGRSKVIAFTAGGLLVLVAMMFAPEFALRTGFHSTLFLTVGSAAAFKEITPWLKQALTSTRARRVCTLATGTLCCLYALLVMVGCFCIEGSYRRQADERLARVQHQKGQPLIVVPAFRIPYGLDGYLGPRSFTDFHLIYGADLESKPTDNRSLMYARYYGLPPICIDRQVDWEIKN